MKNKTRKLVVFMAGAVLSAGLIFWVVLSASKRCSSFWEISFAEWVPIFIAFEIAFIFSYLLTYRKERDEKVMDTYEQIIVKMQKYLHEDPANLFSQNMYSKVYQNKIKFYEQEILLYFRRLYNYLEFLKCHRGDLNIDYKLTFINGILDSYKFELTENLTDWENLKEKRMTARRSIDLIDYKLDEIRFDLQSRR